MPTLHNPTDFPLDFEGVRVPVGGSINITDEQAARVAPTGVWDVIASSDPSTVTVSIPAKIDSETKLEEAARLLIEADEAEKAS